MNSTGLTSVSNALKFTLVAECSVSKARTSVMELPHYKVELPIFMPVGTQGTIKGLTPEQVEETGAQIILGNTYHLGMRPGKETLTKYESLHEFMKWKRALLTDSGGFQMVSLLKLAEITEEGVKFQSPYDGSESMLTPEESIHIQNTIGADIMMQLDDVVDVRESNYERFSIAVDRTTRWLDRCMKANKNAHKQNLFPIVQGGLFPDLRKRSLEQLIERDAPGYAIGGLSGGEDKNKFWPTVDLCTNHLPKNKPRYCMGVGMPVDLVVCCALGVDMFDCVYPTRTARFGCAIVDGGQINLKAEKYKFDFNPIDSSCSCFTCQNHTRAYLRTLVTKETVGCHLVSIHNMHYTLKLMENVRKSIKIGKFVEFVKDFMKRFYPKEDYPQWTVDALGSVGIILNEKRNSCDIKDEFEDDLEMTENGKDLDKLSGFQNSNINCGYRCAVLEDYKTAAEEGRTLGYKVSMLPVTRHEEPKNENSNLINPTWLLSEWLGVLLACQTLNKNLSEEDSKQLESLVNKINQILKKIYDPSLNLLEEFCEKSEQNSFNETCHLNHNLTGDALQCIDECKSFCQSHWKVPQHLV